MSTPEEERVSAAARGDRRGSVGVWSAPERQHCLSRDEHKGEIMRTHSAQPNEAICCQIRGSRGEGSLLTGAGGGGEGGKLGQG